MRDALTITNVTVVDGTGGPPIPAAEVLVRAGRFTEIRPSGLGALPDGDVLDGRGGFLVPGLWESHTHLRAREPLTPQAGAARLETLLAGYREAGITTVVELGGPLDVNTALRAERERTPSVGAELLFAGPSFTGIDGWPLHLHHNHTLVREVRDAESARELLEAVLAAGTDVVKIIYDGEHGAPEKLPREALPALIELAHAHARRVVVHIRDAQDIVDALEAGADGIEHTFVPGDRSEPRRVAELFARSRAIFTPTLAVFEQIGRGGDRTYLDELVRDGICTAGEAEERASDPAFGAPFPHHPRDESRRRLEHGFEVISAMREAGVRIAAGSDVGFVMSRPAALFRELQLLTHAGLRPGEIIVTATQHCAAKLGRDAESGTIAPGRTADAVVLDADPTSDVMHLIRPKHRVATLRKGHVTLASARSTV